MMLIKRLKSKLFINMNHFKALCLRYVSLIASDKISLLSLIFQAPIMLIVILTAVSRNFSQIFIAQMTMFVISVICVIMATLNSYREICKERDVLIRETNVGLDSTSYVLSKVVVQGVICFFQAIILVTGTCLALPFNLSGAVAYLNYFFFTYLVLLASTCVGLFISAILKSSDTAILPVLFIIIAQVVLSGVIVDLGNSEWISVVAVTRWAMGGYGHIFHFKEYPGADKVLKGIYDLSYGANVLVLLGICIASITFSIIAVKSLRKRRVRG